MARPFDLVAFDLGGVLVRTVESWEEAHALAGLPGEPPRDGAFSALLGELGARADGSLTSERFGEIVAAASGGRYAVEDVRGVSHAWLLGEHPGIGAIFDALDAVGVETALLSNTNDAHWDRLVASDGEAEFPTLRRARHRFASHLLGLVKPDPAIYREVERRTGHDAGRILFFDDLEANVEGVRAVGWTAERVGPDGDVARRVPASLRRHRLVP